LTLPEAKAPTVKALPSDSRVTPTLFSKDSILESIDLTDSEIGDFFGNERRNSEHADDGHMLSFFAGDSHVVLRPKDLRVLRPHGHLMRSGAQLVPDEASMTSTAWMAGVFTSLVTQGHANINRVL